MNWQLERAAVATGNCLQNRPLVRRRSRLLRFAPIRESLRGILNIAVKSQGANVAISLVTGTSSGIGLATAVTLARGGHKVIATMRNLDGAGELRKIVSAEGLPITLATLDVDDDASVNDAVGKVLAENGCIDVLVNNAGVGGGGSVEEVPIGAFRQVMETNFFGGLRCIKAVIASMRERRQGCIVNVTSLPVESLWLRRQPMPLPNGLLKR